MQGRCDVTDEKLLSALDLLDSLVDGNLDTVTKSRVTTWKKMMRTEIAENPEPPGLACPLDHHMCPRAWTKDPES